MRHTDRLHGRVIGGITYNSRDRNRFVIRFEFQSLSIQNVSVIVKKEMNIVAGIENLNCCFDTRHQCQSRFACARTHKSILRNRWQSQVANGIPGTIAESLHTKPRLCFFKICQHGRFIRVGQRIQIRQFVWSLLVRWDLIEKPLVLTRVRIRNRNGAFH